jgi:hypothetical protein
MDEQDLLNIPELENTNVFENNYDQELFKNSNENDYFKVIIENHEDKCMGYLRSKNFISLTDAELEDVFTESIMILLEKIRKGGFTLTVPLGVYLISVCRNKFLQIVKTKKTINLNQEIGDYFEDEDDLNNENNNSLYDFEKFGKNLAYSFEEESEIKKDFLERSIIRMTQLLEQMRANGENCYELITLFSYEKLRIADITIRLGYASDAVTKNLRSRCLRSLKLLSQQIN